jgi:hypothetical protein
MVGRIDWGRYDGGDVEAVIAMMINREHPNSERITPSVGDGGIDILDRAAADGGGDVVYQVKRYAGPLTSGQKSKVKKSAERLLDEEDGDPRWRDLNVTVWRLVTPWDPSPEAEKWLQDTVSPYGVKVVWDGLTLVDQLSAKYTDVIDYYLHDGKSAIQDAYREAMALMSLDKSGESNVTVPEVTNRIEKALGILSHDPHYAYEVRFGQGEPAAPAPRDGLVMSTYRVDPTASKWQAVDVIARCAVSTDERPTTINGVLNVEGNPQLEAAVREFFEFGTPFTSSEGAFNGTIDAPGGLGGELVNAAVRTFATGGDLGSTTELHLEVLDPDDVVVAEANVDRTDRSSGTAGIRVVLTEIHDVFELTMRGDLTNQTGTLGFELKKLDGIPASAALPALEVLAHFAHPNRYRVSARNTPSHLGKTAPISKAADTSMTDNLTALAREVRVLHELQQHTHKVIVTPDPAKYFADQRKVWRFVATILRGGTVTVTAEEDSGFQVVLAPGTAAPSGTFSVQMPLEALIGEARVSFGTVLAQFTNAELVGEAETSDRYPVFTYVTPDRTMRYTADVEESHE